MFDCGRDPLGDLCLEVVAGVCCDGCSVKEPLSLRILRRSPTLDQVAVKGQLDRGSSGADSRSNSGGLELFAQIGLDDVWVPLHLGR